MYQGMFHEQEFRIFHPLFWIWSHMGSQDVNIIFFASLLLYVKVLQFKLHLFYEIDFIEIKKLNIAKGSRKIPKSNLKCHIQ